MEKLLPASKWPWTSLRSWQAFKVDQSWWRSTGYRRWTFLHLCATSTSCAGWNKKRIDSLGLFFLFYFFLAFFNLKIFLIKTQHAFTAEDPCERQCWNYWAAHRRGQYWPSFVEWLNLMGRLPRLPPKASHRLCALKVLQMCCKEEQSAGTCLGWGWFERLLTTGVLGVGDWTLSGLLHCCTRLSAWK